MTRLRDDLHLQVHYEDATPTGAAITGLCDAIVQRTCARAIAATRARGGRIDARTCRRLLAPCFSPTALGALYSGPRTLRESCVYPPADRVRPIALVARIENRTHRLVLDSDCVGDLAAWIAEWGVDARRPGAGASQRLWDELEGIGAWTRHARTSTPAPEGVTWIGHATVAVSTSGSTLLFDPFLLGIGDDGPTPIPEVDAVFVTHSHPDHFDLASLLRLPADVPIHVPAVDRESLLAIDMCGRLRELGFRHVVPLAWGSSVVVGPHRITAHPFHGEQPTAGDVLHPETRNAGNTYVVETDGLRVSLVADAGRDAAGDCRAVAEHARTVAGPVDVVFGGFRAWNRRPIDFPSSSVARYLLFVPPEARGDREKIMNDADDLVITAARWGAQIVVPYANGGAARYWRRGLGPHPARANDPSFDPDVAAVTSAAERHGGSGRPTPTVYVPSPGHTLRLPPGVRT